MACLLSESQIQEKILDYLVIGKRISAWPNPTSGYYDAKRKIFRKHVSKHTRNGVTDIIGLLTACGLFIEVKTPKELKYLLKHYEVLRKYVGPCKKKNHLREQITFIEEAKSKGHLAFFADSVEAVKQRLEEVSA